MTPLPNKYPHTAVIQVPTDASSGFRLSIPCEFHGLEAKRLKLVVGQRLSISTPVSVEYNDALFLGEVLICKPQGAEKFHVEIKVEQILTGLQSLLALRARLLGEGLPQTVLASAVPVVHANRN